MATTEQPRAQSLYRQLRLTFTESISGQVSYNIYAKGLNDPWSERHLLVRATVDGVAPLRGVDDVLRCVLRVVQDALQEGDSAKSA